MATRAQALPHLPMFMENELGGEISAVKDFARVIIMALRRAGNENEEELWMYNAEELIPEMMFNQGTTPFASLWTYLMKFLSDRGNRYAYTVEPTYSTLLPTRCMLSQKTTYWQTVLPKTFCREQYTSEILQATFSHRWQKSKNRPSTMFSCIWRILEIRTQAISDHSSRTSKTNIIKLPMTTGCPAYKNYVFFTLCFENAHRFFLTKWNRLTIHTKKLLRWWIESTSRSEDRPDLKII